jgi:hypothetical protein
MGMDGARQVTGKGAPGVISKAAFRLNRSTIGEWLIRLLKSSTSIPVTVYFKRSIMVKLGKSHDFSGSMVPKS